MASYMGISFPFRIGVRGGVVVSSANETTVLHIVESMQQILLTNHGERAGYFDFGADLDTSLFSPTDASSLTLISYQIQTAIRNFEPRVKITDIKLTAKDGTVYADIVFQVKALGGEYSASLKVGEIPNE